jgi:hypothetical protein
MRKYTAFLSPPKSSLVSHPRQLINGRNRLFTVLEAEKSKVKAPSDLGSGVGLFLNGASGSAHGGRDKHPLFSLFIRAPVLFMRADTS